MIPVLAQVDFGDLMKAVLIFVFFILPVVRGILTSRKQQEEARRRKLGQPLAKPDQARTGSPAETEGELDAWEALLRGELVPDVRQAPPEVAAPSVRTEAEEVARPEAVLSVEEVARFEAVAPLEEAARSEAFAARPGAGYQGTLAEEGSFAEFPTVISGMGGLESGALAKPLGAALPSELDGGALSSKRSLSKALAVHPERVAEIRHGGWKRAIVLSEILSPPIALRDGPTTGPRF